MPRRAVLPVISSSLAFTLEQFAEAQRRGERRAYLDEHPPWVERLPGVSAWDGCDRHGCRVRDPHVHYGPRSPAAWQGAWGDWGQQVEGGGMVDRDMTSPPGRCIVCKGRGTEKRVRYRQGRDRETLETCMRCGGLGRPWEHRARWRVRDGVVQPGVFVPWRESLYAGIRWRTSRPRRRKGAAGILAWVAGHAGELTRGQLWVVYAYWADGDTVDRIAARAGRRAATVRAQVAAIRTLLRARGVI